MVAIDAGQAVARAERANSGDMLATPPMPAVTPLSDPVASLLDPRRRVAARWREAVRQAQRDHPALAAPLASLEVSERQQAERLARELPLMSVEVLRQVADRLGPLHCAGPPTGIGSSSPIAALELAIDEESRLQGAFADLAAETPDAELRLRAMALALAATRHLKVLREAVLLLRCKL